MSIEIIINSRGSVEVANLKFTPSMVNSTITNSIIYFPSNFILSNERILKAVKDSDSVMEILTDLSMYEKLVLYYTDKARGYKPVSLNDEKTKKIIENNINYMLKLWLNPKTKIFINNNAYTIIKSKIKKYTLIKKPLDIIQIIVDIQVVKDASFIGIKQITCADNRDNINKKYTALFGRPLFVSREQKNKYPTNPLSTTNNTLMKDQPKPIPKPFPNPNINPQTIHIHNYYNQEPQKTAAFKTGGKKRTLRKRRRRRFKRTRAHRV